MAGRDLRRLALLIVSILAAVLAADRLTALIISGTGISGTAGFLAGFVLYGILFFGILALIERVTGFRIFQFAGRD